MNIKPSIKPSDVYSPDWLTYWATNPHSHRGVGADAAEATGEVAQEGTQTGDPAAAGVPGKTGDQPGKAGSVQASGDATQTVPGGKDAQVKSIDWREGLPDDLKELATKIASPADALRSIQQFRKRESQVRVPGKNATPEENAAYRKAIGIPEKPEEYQFPDLPQGMQLTDDVKASRQVWSKRFHELGLPANAVKALSQFANEDAQQQLLNQIDADKAFATKQDEALKKEWRGEDYEANKQLANRAFNDIANRAGINLETLTQIKTSDDRFLMDNAAMVKIFAVIGREMSEGNLGPSMNETERETVQDQIRSIRAEIETAKSRGESKRANQLYQREMALVAKIGGSKAIVGSHGRTV